MLNPASTTALTAKQLTTIREATGRVNLWSGAVRSGKTIGSLVRWLIFVATAPSTGELVMTGRTRDAVWRNVIAPLQDVDLFGVAAGQVVGNHGAPTVTILGRRVHVIGASDAKAEATIRGMTVAGAYVDEVTTLASAYFNQLLARMSVPGSALFATTNPDSPAHWLKKDYLDRLTDLPDWRSWSFTLDDNPTLPPAYVASVKAEFSGLFYRRFVLGEWVAAEGSIYDAWDPGRHVVPHTDLPPIVQLLGTGVDYGTTNATAAIMLGLGVDDRLYLVDEWRYAPTTKSARWTDAQLARGIATFHAADHELRGDPLPPRWLFVDPAAASLQVQLAADGVRGIAHANNDVLYGIRTVASLLASDRLRVSDRVAGFIAEAPGYSWDDKASEKGEDKPIKVADHSLDAARYAITTSETVWRRRVPLTTPGGAHAA